MKSYTDLEQSEKLAEFLPIENADMVYQKIFDNNHMIYRAEIIPYRFYSGIGVPCWSLAALISVLPRVDIEKEMWTDDTYDYLVKAYIDDGYVGDWFDNPVDACYDMIITLNKDKLLYV